MPEKGCDLIRNRWNDKLHLFKVINGILATSRGKSGDKDFLPGSFSSSLRMKKNQRRGLKN